MAINRDSMITNVWKIKFVHLKWWKANAEKINAPGESPAVIDWPVNENKGLLLTPTDTNKCNRQFVHESWIGSGSNELHWQYIKGRQFTASSVRVEFAISNLPGSIEYRPRVNSKSFLFLFFHFFYTYPKE